MDINRLFGYWVLHQGTGQIVFLGRVLDLKARESSLGSIQTVALRADKAHYPQVMPGAYGLTAVMTAGMLI